VWILAVVLLGGGVAAAVGHLRRRALAVVPALLAVVAVAAGVVDGTAARSALGDLVEPLIFVALAVPLAVLLDERGCFDAVARRLPVRATAAGLWVLGAATVALVNLDAAVVLLTPVAIRAAARAGEDARGLALQPALLASLSSSWLPVSNLTNLIAEEHDRQGPAAFLVHLGPPSLAAVAVGYVLWRRAWPRRSPPAEEPRGVAGPSTPADGDDRAALVTAAVVGVALLVGFTAGGVVGVPPWVVAGVVVAGLVAHTRSLPVAAVPWASALVVAGLAVLAVAAAAHLDVAAALGHGEGAAGLARIVGVGAVGANLANNLPTFLAGLGHLPAGDAARWAWLLGVNMGPTVLVTGSLAGLLWVDVARRSGLAVGARDYARAGLLVGLPALLVGTAVLTLTA
jgi:arsenical pump membrane protein